LGSSNLAGKHEGRDSRFWEPRPWRRSVQLHRRTTGRWSHAGRKLGIGDVVRALSGDTSALCCGCRNGALRAHFTHATPPGPIGHGMAEMSVWPAVDENRNGRYSRHEHTRELEFGHGQHNCGCIDRLDAAASIAVHRTPPLGIQAGDGRPCAQGEQRSSSNPRAVSQIVANTFLAATCHEDDLVRSASVAMIAKRCSPYLSALA
jgi:hypothetical protein